MNQSFKATIYFVLSFLLICFFTCLVHLFFYLFSANGKNSPSSITCPIAELVETRVFFVLVGRLFGPPITFFLRDGKNREHAANGYCLWSVSGGRMKGLRIREARLDFFATRSFLPFPPVSASLVFQFRTPTKSFCFFFSRRCSNWHRLCCRSSSYAKKWVLVWSCFSSWCLCLVSPARSIFAKSACMRLRFRVRVDVVVFLFYFRRVLVLRVASRPIPTLLFCV